MTRKKKTTTVAAVPAGSELVTSDESPIQNLKALNTRLLLEIKQLRSELAASVARNGAELRRANDQLEAERAAASVAMVELVMKVQDAKYELEAKEAMIRELGQELKLAQSQENRRGKWAWLIPLTTVIVAACALAYATH